MNRPQATKLYYWNFLKNQIFKILYFLKCAQFFLPQVPLSIQTQNRMSSPISVSGTPPITSARATPPSSNPTPPLQQIMPPTSSSFLQSLLNGDPPRPPIHMSNPHAVHTHTPNPHQGHQGQPPTLSTSIDMSKLEHVVTKLTRKHMGLNSRESYQCQVCSKWFAVPPIKHLRGHLVTFKVNNLFYW